MNKIIRVEDAHELAFEALRGVGMPEEAAQITARALVAAERDELSSHGLARLPFYLEQALSGKVNPKAQAQVSVRGAVVRVDAQHGLAFPAVSAGLEKAIPLARELGLVAVSIAHSHHFGVAGYHVEQVARQGLLALAFSNAPSAMAPWGGSTPLFGTNPIAFASPRQDAEPVVIDLSLSKVARGKIMLAKKAGTSIPEGWAIDSDGHPTTDPDAALAGSMVPAAEAKGAALALMVELLTAGLTGCHFGYQASSFFDAEGDAPNVAHLMLIIDPPFFGPGYPGHVEALFKAMLAQEGVRLPSERRYAARSNHHTHITLPQSLIVRLEEFGRRQQGQRLRL
ncbi:(2R)-3-sulfolactate dehydrogenase (NADP(+)) [Pseudomonas fluorescens]|uniref:(2R)-3-sulfolactate dehydrogenase (NADP(+)) n=1 Tax=Pseudomonas fluorescens TaxID=294 RepID=A0A5E6RSC0_PSEFL|nr:Ldh family oxidoreductase [Pseudomonas fluorescens]VVM67068.1 (2R)-3-sulfolactate dehydrogenase (NADP(+)) [Pseudomonas fluorescens]